MGQLFEYARFRRRDTGEILSRPCLEVIARYQGRATSRLVAVVDTGADNCMLSRTVAGLLHIDLDRARSESVGGLNGPTATPFVDVTIEVPQLSLEFQTRAGFKTLPAPFDGVLGHRDFLANLRVCFVQGQYFEILRPRSRRASR
jgi:hypothetical protein